jgi:uncharacterized protein
MIDKNKILEILNDWNLWGQKEIETGVERADYLEKMEEFLTMDMIVSLVGLRRSGKSTLLLQLSKRLIAKKKAKKEEILYVNFEDSRFLGEYSLQLLNDIYETYLENLNPTKKPIILLDEIQNIPGWEKFVNSLYERKTARIFVSGSNAQLLQSEYSEVLTGRQIVLRVYPLTFKEFILFQKVTVKNKLEMLEKKNKLNLLLGKYLRYGGLPKVALAKTEEEKELLAQNYFSDILNRDLIKRFRIKEIGKLEILAKFYFTNISSMISYNKISRFIKIPSTTIERFSDYLTTPYLFYFVNKFSFSLKEQSVNARKVYTADLGLRNAISFSFSEDRGKLLENSVAMHLIQTQKEIYYFRTKNNREVDFLVKKGTKEKALIQVCATLKDFPTQEREIKALFEAMEELKLKTGLILTENEEREIKDRDKIIKVMPIWKWLLEV